MVLIEELDWLGGQLTSQAVPLDEHPWVAESLVSSASFTRSATASAPSIARICRSPTKRGAIFLLNPGVGNVGTLCCEPIVALQVMEAMLAPAIAAGLLIVLRRHRVSACVVDGDSIKAVEAIDLEVSAAFDHGGHRHRYLKPADCRSQGRARARRGVSNT